MQKLTSPSRILTIVALLGVIFWLFFSYAPASLIALPPVAINGKASGAFFQVLAIVCLMLFILIQFILVRSTLRALPRQEQSSAYHKSVGEFKIHVLAEFFWTILPLLTTIGFAFACYQVWSHLPSS